MTKGVSENIKAELEKLAEEMTEYFQANDAPTVTLLAPEALTVRLPSKGFRKVSHIGQEEFVPHSVYLGAKSKLIARFRPASAAAYQHMEMPVDDALERLEGFAACAHASCRDGYQSRMSEIRREIQKEREAQELANKADVYADIGFGSW